MAEKGFGVKEVNLIGPSGTPTITSPNNLNLNAVNVAISTNVSIGGTLSVTGNVSIGGTLTYEDVTNIDSVGIVTAREGIIIPDNKALSLGNRLVGSTAGDLRLYHDTNNSYIDEIGSGNLFIRNGSNNSIYCQTSGTVQLYYNGNDKLATTNTGVTVSGTLVATTFSGSGASLTNLPAANLTGTVADARISTLTASKLTGALPAISGANLTNLPADTPTNTDIQVVYTVTANGSSAYRFGGNGIVSTADNPDVYLIRGLKYRFINNSGGSHPFQIRVSNGGSAYSSGVTNNGASSGNIDFQVPYSAPSHLYYQCTSHGGMVGNLYIRGAGGNNTNVGVTTFTSNIVVQANPAEVRIQHAGNSSYSRLISDNQNALNIYTGGGPNLAMKITSTRAVQITGADDQDNLVVNGGSSQFAVHQDDTDGEVSLRAQDGSGNNFTKYMTFFTEGGSGPIERLRIDSVGRVFFTNNTGSGTSRVGGRIELSQNNPETWITINESSDSGTGPALYINRTRGTNVSSPGPVQNGNYIGSIHFGSYDTNSYEKGASIQVMADGQTWANGDCPARMAFHTTPDNSTTPVERLRITRDGKIGVNATTTALIAPTYTLDLGGNDGVLNSGEQNTLRIRCNNGGTAIRIAPGGGGSRITMMRADGESNGSKCFGETDSSAYGVSLVYHGDRSGNENSFAVYMDASTAASQIEAFNIRQNGDYMHGGSSYSDRDHKENITSLPGTALDKITQLTPRTWNWKPEYHDIPTDKIFGGFVAQEVLPHIPSIVTGTDGQGDMALDYQGLLAWTIKALTELKSENDNLKARVNTLESS